MTEQKEPLWVEKKLVLAIHHMSLVRHGGAFGLRDEGLLESALARPHNLFAYGNPDLCDLAAAYASGIIRNHPFVDGNKRTGFVVAATFLDSNDIELTATEEEVVRATQALAAGEMAEEGYKQWLRDRTQPRPSDAFEKPHEKPVPQKGEPTALRKSSRPRRR
ncbi:MAG: type II toxin-antitoxin system death-on-curing family toxin [Micavibrio sp.]|nr:MAG: type II toxin-antitoxin system death-on-curing family toxin [Micavibrio sp.]